jgi:predicted DNA-binding transcriptional regulator YafY
MNRFDRVTSILIQLQSRKIVKAQDLAERFGVSLRTIYRDIRSLEEAGIPLYGEAGVGYSMADGYRLPPVMFTREEAMAFLTAEKLIEKFADLETGNSYKEALYKVKAVLKGQEKDLLEEVEERIIVRKKLNPLLAEGKNKRLPPILQAIGQKTVLTIDYQSFYKREKTRRCLEPIGIFYESGNWHLIAYCRLRGDYRDFRIDRITGLQVSEEHFLDQHPSLTEYLDTLSKQKNLVKAVIRMKKDISRYIDQDKLYYGVVMETEDGEDIEMTFLTESLEGFARWVMMFGNRATVLEPQQLVDRVTALAAETLSLYQEKYEPQKY